MAQTLTQANVWSNMKQRTTSLFLVPSNQGWCETVLRNIARDIYRHFFLKETDKYETPSASSYTECHQ